MKTFSVDSNNTLVHTHTHMHAHAHTHAHSGNLQLYPMMLLPLERRPIKHAHLSSSNSPEGRVGCKGTLACPPPIIHSPLSAERGEKLYSRKHQQRWQTGVQCHMCPTGKMVGMAKLGSDCQHKQGSQTQKRHRKLSPAKFLLNLTIWILSLCHKRGDP